MRRTINPTQRFADRKRQSLWRFTPTAAGAALAIALSLMLIYSPFGFGQPPTAKSHGPKSTAPLIPNVGMQSRVKEVFANLPLSFEQNQGQTNKEVLFMSRGAGHTLWLMNSEIVIAQRGARKARRDKAARSSPDSPGLDVFLLRLAGANHRSKVEGLNALRSRTNFFIGNDPRKWRTQVRNFSKVRYRDIYPGVDLVYYGNEDGQLEYDFVVAPGADPRRIALEVETGVRLSSSARPASARLSDNGDLILRGSHSDLRFHKPIVYQQDANGARRYIAGNYVLQPTLKLEKKHSRLSFEIANYNHSKPLIIDPAITYMSYVGGGADRVTAVAAGRDPATGKTYLYVAGNTGSTLLPVSPDALQSTLDASDAYIAKLDPSASGAASLIYLSYFGGAGGADAAALAVDGNGNSYLTGSAGSDAFPQVQPLVTGLGSVQSAFLTKFSPDGSSILFSTRFGGTQGTIPYTFANAIAVDGNGNAYIGGSTKSFIPLANPYLSSGGPGFVAGFSTNGTPSLIYSTYLGQGPLSPNEIVAAVGGLALGPSGTLYVTGGGCTVPIVSGYQSTGGGFFAVLAPNGYVGHDQLRYSTTLGGGFGSAVAVDASGNAYAAAGSVVVKINPFAIGSASLVYSTGALLGDSLAILGLAVDSAGNAYVAGGTNPDSFPLVNPVQSSMYGVSQTIDGGKTWVALGNGLASLNIWALTVDTSMSPHNLYAATIPDSVIHPDPNITPPGITLYKSIDGGLNWQPCNNGLQGLWVMETAVDPMNNSVVYAATSDGVYRSTDQGASWFLFNPGTTDLASQFVTALAFDGPTIYAGTLNGLYAHNGAAWVRKNFTSLVDHIAVDSNSPSHVLYISDSAQYYDGPYIWKSVDSGDTWTLLSGQQHDSMGIGFAVLDPRTIPATIYGLGFSPTEISPAIWVSSDAGVNWSLLSNLDSLNPGEFENRIALDSTTSPATLYAADFSNGVYRSTNGGSTWDLILNGGTVGLAIDTTTASSTSPSTVYAGNYGFEEKGFIAKLNPAGSAIVFSSLIGGVRGQNRLNSLALDSNGTLYVGGFSDSTYLPTTNAFEPTSPTPVVGNIVETGFVAAIGDAQLSVPVGCSSCTATAQVGVPTGALTISLPDVTGSTTGGVPTLSVTSLSASDAANFSLSNNLGAYDISTTATFNASESNPITVCFQALTVNDATTFNGLRLIHIVNGNPVDSTSSRDFSTRTICGSVTSLSPFILINGTPTVSWSSPGTIIYGTPLSSTQLNATANVPGTFTYTPDLGAVLGPGQQTLWVTFTPTNPALYSSLTTTTSIDVQYSTAPCNGDHGHSILQPIDPEGTSVFKLGSTVPTKVRVCDVNGVSVGTPGTISSYQLVAAGATTGLAVDEQVYSTAADAKFRWDPTAQQWIFNQGTGKNNPSLSHTNTIYVFRIGLNDGTYIQFQYGLK